MRNAKFITKTTLQKQKQKLGEFLLSKEYFNTTDERSAQLSKEDDAYVVKICSTPKQIKPK
ncbi:MAG TPA: hypothetical protein VNA26_09190 [Chitinophagaceae bacterium]|nr:hypothetical protein [Chitinophagaceae bacterium]